MIYYAGLMPLASLLRRPVFVYSQGIDRSVVGSTDGLRAPRTAAQRTSPYGTRDRLQCRIDRSPDPVLALTAEPRHRSLAGHRRMIVVSVRPWRRWPAFEATLAVGR